MKVLNLNEINHITGGIYWVKVEPTEKANQKVVNLEAEKLDLMPWKKFMDTLAERQIGMEDFSIQISD